LRNDVGKKGTDIYLKTQISFEISELERDLLQSGKDKEAKPGKGYLAGAVHKAEMPDFHKAAGKNMLKKPPEKLKGIDGDVSRTVAP